MQRRFCQRRDNQEPRRTYISTRCTSAGLTRSRPPQRDALGVTPARRTQPDGPAAAALLCRRRRAGTARQRRPATLRLEPKEALLAPWSRRSRAGGARCCTPILRATAAAFATSSAGTWLYAQGLGDATPPRVLVDGKLIALAGSGLLLGPGHSRAHAAGPLTRPVPFVHLRSDVGAGYRRDLGAPSCAARRQRLALIDRHGSPPTPRMAGCFCCVVVSSTAAGRARQTAMAFPPAAGCARRSFACSTKGRLGDGNEQCNDHSRPRPRSCACFAMFSWSPRSRASSDVFRRRQGHGLVPNCRLGLPQEPQREGAAGQRRNK